ncbi:hypothetical protein [Aliamphritea spongicola]|uniref:hypothetical protein n=1 Tax=Aliamphritea spongicola TaxID=707589 RepID=UPI00196B6B28|nr:hypothetical protein [Aliamphritea spongicola]MBN3562969.1 hypothetical protein [Aliamphritea spongicola]
MTEFHSVGKILIVLSCIFTICAVYYSIGKSRIDLRCEEILVALDDLEDYLSGKPDSYRFFVNQQNDIWEHAEYRQLRENLSSGSHWNFRCFPPRITLKDSFCYRIDYQNKQVFILVGEDNYDWDSLVSNLYTESAQHQAH